MKTIAKAALAVAVLMTMLAGPHPAETAGICDSNQSTLCSSLIEWWNFEEATNTPRFGAYGDWPLMEWTGNNLPTAAAKLGSASLLLDGTSGQKLWSPRLGDLPPYFTIAAWVYQTNQTGTQVLIATGKDNAAAYDGVSLGFNAGKPYITVYEDETDTSSTHTAAAAMTANAWHLVVWKLSPYGPYGKAQGCASVDNAAFACTALNYNRRLSPAGDLHVGGTFVGRIDGLGIWGRAWSPRDMWDYYNSGAGRTFPFY